MNHFYSQLSLKSAKVTSFKQSRIVMGLILTIQLLFAGASMAQTNTWDGSSNNNWNNS